MAAILNKNNGINEFYTSNVPLFSKGRNCKYILFKGINLLLKIITPVKKVFLYFDNIQ